jgi:hypothetical protein
MKYVTIMYQPRGKGQGILMGVSSHNTARYRWNNTASSAICKHNRTEQGEGIVLADSAYNSTACMYYEDITKYNAYGEDSVFWRPALKYQELVAVIVNGDID